MPLNATDPDAGNVSESDQNVSERLAQAFVGEMQDLDGMPEPKETGEKGGGMGELGKSLEFLMLKVAQLETFAELQQTELGMAQKELGEHRALIKKLLKKCGPDDAEISMVQKQKGSEERVQEAHDILTRVLQKHAHQREHKEYHPQAHEEDEEETAQEEEETVKSERRALLQKRRERRSAWGPIGKAVKAVGKVAETGVKYAHEGVGHAVNTLDGTGLTGGALTEAYQAAAKAGNAAKFLANTAIETVEMAAAIVTGGGKFGASCSNTAPWLGMHGSRLDINFGHQKCTVSLLTNTITLFDFNWGRKSINIPVLDLLPAPVRLVAGTAYEAVRTVFSVGFELMHCHHRGHHHDLIRCLAHWVYGLVNPLPWLPEPVKLVPGSAYEAIRTVFSVGWELMHCPHRGHHHQLIQCLGGWIQHLAPPLHWLPHPVHALANGQIMSLLPGQLNQIATGNIMGLLPGQLNQIASGNIMGLLPGQLNQIASGDIMGLMPGPMQLLGGGQPNSIQNMLTLGNALMKCADSQHSDLVQCLGFQIVGSVPPLNFLNRLGEIFGEFIAAFAKVASTVAAQAMKGGESLLQTAATTEFPSAGAQAMVHHRGPNLVITKHSQQLPTRQQALLQEMANLEDPDDPPAAVKWSFEDYGPETHALVTQFNGRETATGSCLAFAPRNKTGSNNQATQEDWQAGAKDDFIKLEPWAVPCGNQWMKDHWDKWQGYSFYSVDFSIEKCLTVTFQLNMQPVVAFVGGIQFDLLPGPLAEIDTQVCWPRHQPGGLDLSVLRSVIKSNGVMLFSRTLRLSKRFGDDTHFVMENVHGGHQTARSFFGASATDGESGTGMASMKRSSLLESNQTRAQAKARLQESLHWETDEEDLYLASVEYGEDMGINKTSEVRGSSARDRINSLQSTSEDKSEADTFKLFGFKNPGLVNFEISGLLSGNWLQLGLQMGFGPAYQSPKMTIPLVNLADQFALILAAVPDALVSTESRARAIAALKDFSSSDIQEVRSQSKMAKVADAGHQQGQEGEWSFSVNSPPVGSDIKRQERPAEVLRECQGAIVEGTSCSHLQEILPQHPAAQSSMVAWFKSEDANPVWKSAVGSWQGRITKGSVTRKVEAGNGATRPVGYLAGLTTAGYDFGKIMKPDFTICSITRYLYAGGIMGRILQSGHIPNFLHGHHGQRVGVAHYNTWVTPYEVSTRNTDWLVMCGNNKGVVYVGNERRNIAIRHGHLHNADFHLYINEGFTGEASDFAVMEVITWNRALSEDEMWTSMEYLNWKLQAHLAHRPSAESSMVAWYKSEDASPAWKSAVGSWQARVTKGSITRKFNAGFGAAVPVAYLDGLTNAGLDFGLIMKPDFTICSITRYLYGGGLMGRILQNIHPNFLHGHWGGQTGVAHYNSWVTHHARSPRSTDWIVMCGNNKGVVYVGKDAKNIAVRHGHLHNADFHLYINEGFTNEASDFAVMEVITWNRALSEDEMWTSMEYLNWKLEATIPYQPADKLSMVAWYKSEDASPAWKSAVGSWQARVTKGSITRKVEAGNGAAKPVAYLDGLTNAGLDFGKIMKPDFTICSITRYLYAGGIMGRILQNIHPNFLHGHHGHRTGVAHYSTWVTPYEVPSSTDWLVMCGNNKGVVYVGNERRNIAIRHGVLHSEDFHLYINEGFTNEASDFAVMEVITWNRALSEDEMWTSMEYLNWKLVTGSQ